MGLKESDFRILNPFRDFKANSRKRVQFPMHCIALNTIYRRLQWPHNRSLQRQSGMPRRAVQQSGKLHASDASFHSDVLQFSSLESRSQRSLFSTILPKFHSLMIQLPFSFEVPFEVSAQVNAAQMEFDPNAID